MPIGLFNLLLGGNILENEFSEIIKSIMALVPVIGGAIIGVAGGLVGTTYAHRLSNGQAKTAEKKEKLESLVSEAYEIQIWLKKQENYALWGRGDEVLERSPISKIKAIELLYFPELNIQVQELSVKALAYEAWLNEGFQIRLVDNKSQAYEEHLEKNRDVFVPLTRSINEVLDKAQEISEALHSP